MDSANSALNILIVDDHSVVRGGIRQILRQHFSAATFSECETAELALEQIKGNSFDLILLDISLPGRSGLDVLSEIQNLKPSIPIVVVSTYSELSYAERSLQLGALGYLHKGASPEEFVKTIDSALKGIPSTEIEVRKNLLSGDTVHSKDELLQNLSEREFSVFLKIAAGLSLKEIAAQLELSPKTVTTYRARVLEKCKVSTNAAITQYALRLGLIQ